MPLPADNACLVLRNTFRLHDNPALRAALEDPALTAIVLPIEAERVCPAASIVPTVTREADGGVASMDVPTAWARRHPRAWGYHQYWFTLLAMRSFQRDLTKQLLSCAHPRHPASTPRIFTCKAPRAQIIAALRRFSRVHLDRVDDDAWKAFDEGVCAAPSGPDVRWHTTQTLLDWHADADCRAFVRQRWLATKPWPSPGSTGSAAAHAATRYSVPYSNGVFRTYVIERLESGQNDDDGADSAPACVDLASLCQKNDCRAFLSSRAAPGRTRRARGGRSRRKTRSWSPVSSRAQKHRAASTAKVAVPRDRTTGTRALREMGIDLASEIQRWKKCLTGRGVTPYTVCTRDLEGYALRRLRETVTRMHMQSVQWEKPKTNASLAISEDAVDVTKRNTSKLSPYFAMGVLSPRTAFLQWWGNTADERDQNEKRPSSAIAQLLWRETFHAASTHPFFWKERPRRSPLAPNQRFWQHEMKERVPGGGWQAWDDFDNPRVQKWRNAEVEPSDLRDSLQLLAVQGWVHHLRRHVMADYLTRGKLEVDWMLGEKHFRQCLLDHDPAVNRGNWLWLSASDFSRNQFIRHYKHSDYIKRYSYGDERGRA